MAKQEQKKRKPLSAATHFIMAQSSLIPVREVVRLAKDAGIDKVTEQRVYRTRAWMKKRKPPEPLSTPGHGAPRLRVRRANGRSVEQDVVKLGRAWRGVKQARAGEGESGLLRLMLAVGTERARELLDRLERAEGV